MPEDVRRCPIEKHLSASLRSLPAAIPHQVGPADPFLAAVTLLPQHPGDRRPVGRNQIGRHDCVRMCGVPARGNETMHVTGAYGPAFPSGSPFEDAIDRGVPAQNVNWHIKDWFTYPPGWSR